MTDTPETATEPVDTVSPETVVAMAQEMMDGGYRLVTYTCTELDETTIDLQYHFDKDLVLETRRMTVPKGKPIPSITGVYLAAFMIENELQDQFGLKFEGLAIDFDGQMMFEKSVRHSPLCRYAVIDESAAPATEAAPESTS